MLRSMVTITLLAVSATWPTRDPVPCCHRLFTIAGCSFLTARGATSDGSHPSESSRWIPCERLG